MKIRLPDTVLAAIRDAMLGLGIRRMQGGSVTLHFDEQGRLAGWQESQVREVYKDAVASPKETAHNTG